MENIRKYFPWLLEKSYPQQDFAEAIARTLAIESYTIATMVDAPCGNGITTKHLATAFPMTKIWGIDLDKTAIATANQLFQNPNVTYIQADIGDLKLLGLPAVDLFCLINSLFLLPAPVQTIQCIHQSLTNNGLLALIIPNIQSHNYRYFAQRFPHVNRLELDAEQAVQFVENCGFRLINNHKIGYFRYFGGFLRKFLVFFFPFFIRIFDRMAAVDKQNTANYHLLLFQKK